MLNSRDRGCSRTSCRTQWGWSSSLHRRGQRRSRRSSRGSWNSCRRWHRSTIRWSRCLQEVLQLAKR